LKKFTFEILGGKIRLIPPETMKEAVAMSNETLAVLAQGGDREALLELWAQVRRFIWKQARRWAGRGGGVERVARGTAAGRQRPILV